MGGSSKSQSTSSNQQTTENYDQKVAVEQDGVGIGAGANVEIYTSDLGAIESAGEALESGFGFAGGVVETVTEEFGRALSENTAILKEQTESDAKELSGLAMKIGGGALAAVALLMLLFKGK